MKRIQLSDDLSFSRIIHGLWRLAEWKQTKEETLSLIEFCLDQGITTFDHADIYGKYTCEALFGEALSLKPELREKMEIVTKCGIVLQTEDRLKHYNTSKKHILNSVENSLQKLQTDYIDVLLIHRPDPFMDPEQVASAFNQLQQEGKVKHFGVSNFKQDQFNMLQSYLNTKLVTNQIEISTYQLENIDDGTLNLCLEKRIPPMAWSPLAGGSIFTAKDEKAVRIRAVAERVADEIGADSMDQVLFAWLLNHPAKIMPIIGSGKQDRIQSVVESLHFKMSHEQWFELLKSSRGHNVP